MQSKIKMLIYVIVTHKVSHTQHKRNVNILIDLVPFEAITLALLFSGL